MCNAYAKWRAALLLSCVLSLLSGCGVFRLSPASMMADSMTGMVDSIRRQPDPQLVREGGAALILFLDGMLAAAPDNQDLLRAASTAYTTYSQAFLTSEADEERAALLYGRAREYGLQLLEQHDFFAGARQIAFEDFEVLLRRFRRRDVPDLYAAGTAWLGWIMSQPGSMAALSELPKALAVMQRALELDETYENGGAHMVFGIYYASQPVGAGQDLAKSRAHFERALDLAGPGNLMPQVMYAEFYGKAAADEALFKKTLERVLEQQQTGADSRHALTNAIAVERARTLLQQRSDYF